MDILYELWIHAICGFEPEIAAKAANAFENTKKSFNSPEIDARRLREVGLAGDFIKRFTEPEFFKEAKDIIKYCDDNGIRILSREDEEYPESLKHIDIPPRLLFVKGKRLDSLGDTFVSVVGCRRPTDQGKVMAFGIGKSLAENGIVTVSGMAEGIDGEAHRGALEGKGPTVAVLAGSVDAVYPACHEGLYRKILESGAVVSERPPRTVVKRYFYQQRNRIVIGMSKGTVVVEGKERSGTAISARLALDNNRDVFAVPGSPVAWQSELPNRLIEEGAMVVSKTSTPAEFYKDENSALYVGTINRANEGEEIDNTEKVVEIPRTNDDRILDFMKEKGRTVYAEEIAEALDIPTAVLGSRLTILSIKGLIRQESGNRYILVK